MLYPYARSVPQRPRCEIDHWAGPGWRLVEHHALPIGAAPEAVLEALASTPLAELRAVTALFSLRGIRFGPKATVREFFSARPFMLLAELDARELVFGVLTPAVEPGGGRHWPSTPGQFLEATARAPLSAVVNFRADADVGGSLLWTETSIRTNGGAASFGFALYWLLIGPWSAWIRRLLLRAARTRAVGR